ncbi:MAG: response regulator [Pyrinomonadaceae bacterium]
MSKPKLLLADDSLTIQKLINLTFADEGFDVVTVGDGNAVLQQISDVQPDIILADVHMPGPNGYEICAMLRGVPETANLPVMLLVGSFEPFDQDEAGRVGASGYATKPFQSIRQLVEQVNGLIGNGAVVVEEEDEIHVSDAPITSDIDSLYEQSFTEMPDMPSETADEIAEVAYANDSFDDAITEISYEEQVNEPVVFEDALTETEDFDVVNFNEHAPVGEESEHASKIDVEYDAPVYDDIPAFQPEMGVETMSVAEMQAAPTEEFRHEMLDPFSSTASEFDLDEIDLLNLTSENATEQYSFTTPAGAAEEGSKKQVVSLSPELIDIIVQKVVEKLSEKY